MSDTDFECPKCKSINVKRVKGPEDYDDVSLEQEVVCEDCDTVWAYIYKFDRVELK